MADAPAHPCHLLELSNEILTLIAIAIYEQTDLRNLSNTCHALHRVVDPILYHIVNIRSIPSCDRFAQVILQHPSRASEVHSLNIHILCYNEDPEDLDGTFIGYLRRLRELRIRFPGLPEGVQSAVVRDIGKTQRFISLHSLRTCELDLTHTDCGMWPLSTAQLLFRHPTLQSLTLHFASSQGGTGILNDIPNASTKLEELNLLSCNISPESLTSILRLPQHLKRLTLGTPFSYSSWDWSSSSAQYAAAMFPVYENLECFRLVAAPALRTTRTNWAQGPATGLQNFTALKYLEIASASLLDPNELYMAQLHPPVSPGDRLMLPPKLEVLKISPKARTCLLGKVLAEKAEVPSLRRLILSMVGEEDVSELRCSCQNAQVELKVVHESAHVSFHGAPVWKIQEQNC